MLFVVLGLGDAGEGNGERDWKAIGTAIALLLFGVTAGAGVSLIERQPRLALFGLLTATVSLLAFAAVVATIWSTDLTGRDRGVEVAGVTAMAAIGMAYVSVLLRPAREGDSAPVRVVRGAAIVSTATLFALGATEILASGDPIGARPLAIIAVLFVLTTALQPLARRAW